MKIEPELATRLAVNQLEEDRLFIVLKRELQLKSNPELTEVFEALEACKNERRDLLEEILFPESATSSRPGRIEKLAQHFTEKFGGKCWAGYDEAKRKYYVRGENLPPAPELASRYVNGWSLLDYFTASEIDKLN